MKFVFLVFFVSSSLCFTLLAKDIFIKASAKIYNDDILEAKERVLKNAQLKAVKKGVEIFLVKKTINDNYQAIKEQIYNLNQNFIIYLKGELGSGKTTFSKGLIKGMGYQELITSPTFSIIERIETIEFYILHIDLYRIERPEEIIELELHEEPNNPKPTVMIIEWPERSHDLILPADIVISFDMTNEINERSIELLSQTNKLGNKIDFR